jgi:hypothetical protein
MLAPMRGPASALLVLPIAIALVPGARADDAGAPVPTKADASVSADAGSAPDASLPLANLLVAAHAIEADGSARELKTSDVNENVAPEARFELEMPALRDVRVRLFDDDDKAVPSTDRLELGQRTRYTLDPNEPLAAGSLYALAIDGQSGEYATDPSGRSYRTIRIELKTSGEKAAPPPGKSAKSKKKPKKRGR